MKFINLVKSTHVKSGKVKYFNDHLQASFHIQSRGVNAFQFELQPCAALADGTSCFELIKPKDACDIDIAKLAPNAVHRAYLKHNVIAIYNPIEHSSDYSKNTFSIYLDENHTLYKLGDRLEIQKITPEYEAILPTINQAVAHASQRQLAEYKQAASLFGKRKQEFEHGKKELERKPAEFDLEAAALCSDAMDYSQ